MTERNPINPDPPYPAGAPQPPDLEVDPEQFLEDSPTVPDSQDVTSETATPEPPD